MAARPAARPLAPHRLERALLASPDRLLVLALCAILATTIPVQLNVFHPYTVFPLFVLLAIGTWRAAPGWYPPAAAASDRSADAGTGRARLTDRVPGGRSPWIATLVALLFAAAWMYVQRHYVSELLSIRRDPAIYTLRGIWLIDHPSPDVTLPQQLIDIKRAVPKVGIDFGAETYQTTRYLQSTTIVPGLIAVAGWIGGVPLLLQANVVIGGVALMCVYAVGRRMAGPVLALVPMVALGLSLPMMAFSRVAYTEPLSMVAVMACLLGLWQAVRTHRPAMWLLAGVGAGSVAICRIDGWVVVIGAYVGIGIYGAFASSRQSRRRILAGFGWFTLAALPVGGLGATDLAFHSPDYLRVLKSQWHLMAVAVPAVALLALLLIVMPGLDVLARRLAAHGKMLGRVAVTIGAVAMVLVLLRPLYLHPHFITDTAGQVANASRQKAEQLPLDPSRSYDDQSLTWISWYLGWPTVIAACLAGLWGIRVAVRERSAGIVVVTSVIAVNAALYLNDASITPDQIWAMRRFLPVILPGGLLLIAWALGELYRHRDRVTARFMPGRPAGSRTPALRVILAVVAAVVALYPLSSWSKVVVTREGAGQYDMVEKACDRLEDQRVLIVGNIPQMGYYQPTFRNLCDSEVITVPATDAATEQQQIAKVLSLWGPGPVKVVSFYSANVPWTADPGPAWFTDTYQMWQSVLSHRPVDATTETTQIWLGTARPDGRVVPDRS